MVGQICLYIEDLANPELYIHGCRTLTHVPNIHLLSMYQRAWITVALVQKKKERERKRKRFKLPEFRMNDDDCDGKNHSQLKTIAYRTKKLVQGRLVITPARTVLCHCRRFQKDDVPRVLLLLGVEEGGKHALSLR